MKMMITGNYASSYGAKLARVQVIAAYPITPQTGVVEKLADFVADGKLDAKFIKVESEQSAMAACVSASNTGARTFTATSAHGLALMHEILMWAAGARLPIVMTNVNRAMAPPWSVWADHQDSIAQRDTGWMQVYCESNQEVLDTVIQMYKVCEDPDVSLPAMMCLDAFFLSHTYEAVDMPDQEMVDEFLPPYKPKYRLDVNEPHMFGTIAFPHQWFMEWRYQMAVDLENAKRKIKEVDKEYGDIFGRYYGGLVEEYRTEGAEVVMIAAGTNVSTAREVVDMMREEGYKVGLVKLRVFRPFPHEEIRDIASRVKMIAVTDRTYTYGYGGPFFAEVKGSAYGMEEPPLVKNYLLGIGGRDVTPATIRAVLKNAVGVLREGKVDKDVEWVELKDGRTTRLSGGDE